MEQKMIPEGYKQTEVGVIPEDWDICDLGEAITLQRGFDLPQRLRKPGKVPIISSSGVSGFHSSAMIKPPGIVTGRYGTIGEVFYVENEFWPLNTTLYVREFKGVIPEYAYHLLKTVDFQSHSGKSGVPGVNRNDVHQERIALPKKEEQKLIATALSDTDALINELEKLIQKKQAIKTATMQQLLTGKTRLPQFALREDGTKKGMKESEVGEVPEDWEVVDIGKVVSITTGDKNTQDRTDEGLYPFFVRSQKVERINSYSFDGEGVLTAGDGVGTGKIFHYINGKFDYHQRVYLMYNFGDEIDGYYFYTYFSNSFYERIMSMTAKSSVDSVRREMISEMPIVLPSKLEQRKISQALLDMGAEIQQLEQRLAKTRQIKQGMMQELLTGRTRLIKPKDRGVEDAA